MYKKVVSKGWVKDEKIIRAYTLYITDTTK